MPFAADFMPFAPMEQLEVGQAVWSAVSGAAVQLAATQLSRASILDCPFDMPLRVLDLRTAPGVRHAGAEVPPPQEEDVLTDMGLSQTPCLFFPASPNSRKVPQTTPWLQPVGTRMLKLWAERWTVRLDGRPPGTVMLEWRKSTRVSRDLLTINLWGFPA